jgi:hypothetical protein
LYEHPLAIEIGPAAAVDAVGLATTFASADDGSTPGAQNAKADAMTATRLHKMFGEQIML